MSVSGQRKLKRNRSVGFGLEPHCAEIMQEYYIVAGKKLKAVIEHTNITEYKHYNLGTNFGIFYHSEYKIPSVNESTFY